MAECLTCQTSNLWIASSTWVQTVGQAMVSLSKKLYYTLYLFPGTDSRECFYIHNQTKINSV